MKKKIRKRSGIIAVFLSLASFALAGGAIVAMVKLPANEFGLHPAFGLWVYSMIFALFSLPFYLFDAITSIRYAVRKAFPIFHIILTVMIFIAIPMCIGIGGGANTAIWYAYYAVLLVMEIVSIAKHLNYKKSEKSGV